MGHSMPTHHMSPPNILDFLYFWRVGRYLWEMKNLKIWGCNSFRFLRESNLKFRGVTSEKYVTKWKTTCVWPYFQNYTPPRTTKITILSYFCCRLQNATIKTIPCFQNKVWGPSKWDKHNLGATSGGPSSAKKVNFWAYPSRMCRQPQTLSLDIIMKHICSHLAPL